MEPFQRKGRSGWYVRVKDARGRWLTRRGGDTRAEAYAALERMQMRERAIREGWIDPQAAEVDAQAKRPIGEVLFEYAAYLRGKGVTQWHEHEAVRCCRRVLDAVGARCLEDVRADRVETWLSELVACGRSHRTRNVYLVRLKAMLNWAVRRERLRRNPLAGIELLPTRVDRREVSRALTPAEFAALLESVPCVRRRAYYLLAGRCGLRWSEVRRVRWEDVDLDRGWLTVRPENEKARRGAEVALSDDVVSALCALDVEASGAVFGSSPTRRTWKRDLERAGIAYDTAAGQADRKCLRKTFATHLCLAGVEFQVAVKAMRHSDPRQTLEFYTDAHLLDLRGAAERAAQLNVGVVKRRASSG